VERAGEVDGRAVTTDTVLVCAATSIERRTRDSLLILGRGAPVVLRGTGIAIWDVFATARSVADAATLLAKVYGTTPEIVQREMLPVLEELRTSGVLVTVG
jgi:hypothetical protein